MNTTENIDIQVWFDTTIGHRHCPSDETDDNCVVVELLQTVALQAQEAYKKGYIAGGIDQITNPTEGTA